MMINLEKPSLDELVHFGVLGMKWGVRRNTKKLNRLTKESKEATSNYRSYKSAVERAAESHKRNFSKEQHEAYIKRTLAIQKSEIERLEIDSGWRKRRVDNFIKKLSNKYTIKELGDMYTLEL